MPFFYVIRLSLLLFLLPVFSGTEMPKPEIPHETVPGSIHIFVALCDNKYQGIVPVPAKIGNGQDPDNNLYWGCGYGIRSYFKKSAEWTFIRSQKLDAKRLERIVFKHKTKNCYLVADAYDGRYIKECTQDFLKSASGQFKEDIYANSERVGIAGRADLVAYIGHDGLMDFNLENTYKKADGATRDAIVLACYSKSYFAPYLKSAGANPMVWTTNLMCPEAYTVHDAISGYVRGEKNDQVRNRAAASYSKFQKCSLKAAKGLLVTGF